MEALYENAMGHLMFSSRINFQHENVEHLLKLVISDDENEYVATDLPRSIYASSFEMSLVMGTSVLSQYVFVHAQSTIV